MPPKQRCYTGVYAGKSQEVERMKSLALILAMLNLLLWTIPEPPLAKFENPMFRPGLHCPP